MKRSCSAAPASLADGKLRRFPPQNMRVKYTTRLRRQCVLDLAKKTRHLKAVILHPFPVGQVGTYISCSSNTQPTSSPPSHTECSCPICTPGSHLPPPTPASSRLCFSAAIYPSDTCAYNAQALREPEWEKGDRYDGRGASEKVQVYMHTNSDARTRMYILWDYLQNTFIISLIIRIFFEGRGSIAPILQINEFIISQRSECAQGPIASL